MLKIDERPDVYVPADEILVGDQIVVGNTIYVVGRIDPKARRFDGTVPAVVPVFHLFPSEGEPVVEVHRVPCIDSPVRVWAANRSDGKPDAP